MQWYYALGGERLGPVEQAEFERLVASAVIREDTLVWRDGMANWLPFADLPKADQGAAGDMAVCAVSGRVMPKNEMVHYEGQWVGAEHRDAFFQRVREGVADPTEMVYAGFWIRFLAKFIDGIAIIFLRFIANVVCSLLLFGILSVFSSGADGPAIALMVVFQIFMALVVWGVGFAYHLFFTRKYDATPGKLALGLRLLRADGEKLSVGRIIGRYFAEWISAMILAIGYIMAGFDEEKRSLHDRICDTRVVRKN